MCRGENRKWGSGKVVWEYIGRNRKHTLLLVDNSADEEQMQTKGGSGGPRGCATDWVFSHNTRFRRLAVGLPALGVS